jgi:hypothetical protein
VLGGKLDGCTLDPVTGFFRNGGCDSSPEDVDSTPASASRRPSSCSIDDLKHYAVAP